MNKDTCFKRSMVNCVLSLCNEVSRLNFNSQLLRFGLIPFLSNKFTLLNDIPWKRCLVPIKLTVKIVNLMPFGRKVKSIIEKDGSLFHVCSAPRTSFAIAFSFVTSEDCVGYVHHSGYVH